MPNFAINANFIAPVVAPYLGESTKVAMTEAQRANGFVPGQPVAAEHVNHELNRIDGELVAVPTVIEIALESAALCNWVDETSGTSEVLYGVTWADTQFVAVGADGVILTSPNGRTWTSQTSGTANVLDGTAWDGSLLCTVGASGTILTSPTGGTWTSRTSGTANDLHAVATSGSLFVAVGEGGTILTSPTGVTWTSRTSGTANDLFGVAWSGALFVAVGANGTIVTSPDGVTWTSRASGTAEELGSVVWNGSQFVAAGTTGTILTSPDGVTWASRTSGTANDLFVAASSNHLIAFSPSNNVAIRISRDAITWHATPEVVSGTFLNAIAWSGQVGVAVGNSGLILRSHAVLNA